MLAAAAMGMGRKEMTAYFGETRRRRGKAAALERNEAAETAPLSVLASFIWRLPWKKILILFAVIGLLAVLGILAIKFAPGLFSPREVMFENKETPAGAPTAPQEKSIGAKLVPEVSENSKMSFGSESSNPKLKILDTPTGWLNVRDAASLDGKAIAKVHPGEEYEYADEQSGWYKIILSNGISGWVYKQYVQTVGD